MISPIQTDAIFKHYKGGFYRFVTDCYCESTGQWMAVYKCFSSSKKYVRPMNEFIEKFKPASQHEAWVWALKKEKKII